MDRIRQSVRLTLVTTKQLTYLGGFILGLFALLSKADAYIDSRVAASIAEQAATKADIQRLDEKLDKIYEILASGEFLHRK